MLGDVVGQLVGDIVGDVLGWNVGTGGGRTTLSVKYRTMIKPGPPLLPPPNAGVIERSKLSAPMPPQPVVRVWTNVSRSMTLVGLIVGFVGDALGSNVGWCEGTVGEADGAADGEADGDTDGPLGDCDGDEDGLTLGDIEGAGLGLSLGDCEGLADGLPEGALVGNAYSRRCTSPPGNAPSWTAPAPQHVVRGMIAHLFRPSSWRQETAAHAQPHESMSCTSHVCLHSSSVRSREPPE